MKINDIKRTCFLCRIILILLHDLDNQCLLPDYAAQTAGKVRGRIHVKRMSPDPKSAYGRSSMPLDSAVCGFAGLYRGDIPIIGT